MNLTIIPIDGAVYVDGFSFSGLQLSAPNDVHALQWKATGGWIEFVDSGEGAKSQNEPITELPEWALAAVAKWQEAKAAKDAKDVEYAEYMAAIAAADAAATAAAQSQLETSGEQTL